MTGFDRVMAYRFRQDDSGDVVAESADPALKPYIGMRFPASDIPAQARRLYVINTLRLIADVRARPVPVVGLQGASEPLDMSYCALRSVSPVHIEYLSNMGVGASMSVSIVIANKLWGMLTCHHMKPRHVPYQVRLACDVLAKILASSVQGALSRAHAMRTDASGSLRSRLAERLLHADDMTLALSAEAAALCELVGAHGAVVADGERVQVYGGVSMSAGAALLHWLNGSGLPPDRMVHLDTLETLPPALRAQMDVWCGLLALPFGIESPCWVVLLRKEQIETISWGGKPEKELVTGPLGPRLTPRGSFDLWLETVNGKAVPWDAIDLESAQKLFDELHLADATHAFRRRTTQLEAANQEMQAFSYSVSHDLRSPLNTINGFSDLLARALGNQAGEKAKHYLSRIRAATRQMGELIDGLLTLAQLSRETLQWIEVDLSAIAKRVVQSYKERDAERQVEVQIAEGMRAWGDARLLSVVIENLVGNAWKFTSKRQLAHIEIGLQKGTAGDRVFFVKDNGAGFDMSYAEKLFSTFERLHSPSDFSGTGIGLATVKRVIERHAGRVWAVGKENEGATFYFTLNEGDVTKLL
jgi:light-regulated signal transduction histidine kinase (bacteriophytochrome)